MLRSTNTPPPPEAHPSMVVNGIDSFNLDRSASPRDNFYRFANGGWLQRNPIPSEYSRWGAFEELTETCDTQLRAILNECVADTETRDPNRRAVAVLFATGMDEATCTEHGLAPLKHVFDAIDAVTSANDVLCLSASVRSQMGISVGVCGIYSIPDAKNSSWEVVEISQSGALGIGDRDFYFLEDKKEIREKYVAHVERMLKLAGFGSADQSPAAVVSVMELETKLAESCMTRTAMRDPLKTYNKFEGAADLAEHTKSEYTLSWADYFDALGLSEGARKTIIVDNPKFLTKLSTVLNEIPIDTWKMYMRYHVLKNMAEYLSPSVKEEHFSFFGTTMTGQPEMKPRWKRVLKTAVIGMLEDSIGILYTDRHFKPIAKKACLDMVNVLTEVLRKRIEEVEWMQAETKTKAKQKLDRFRPMIGYPDNWDVEDIPELLEKVSLQNSYAANIMACKARKFKKVIERIDKPVDPDRWEMPCTLVNAYFHPLKNVIVFPAAILQPPFFFHPTEDSPHGDPAVNFSAIGAVICHEIS